jgi:predicted Zn-dependent peptidase
MHRLTTRAMRESLSLLSLLSLLAACGGGRPESTRPAPSVAASPVDPAAPAPTTPTAPAPAAPAPPKAVEAPRLLAAPLPGDPTKTTIHRLSNGMTVYLSPDPQEPSFRAHVAVRAGSRHDPATSTGLAHYLEHMLFKGTQKLGTLDYAKEKPHLDRIAALYGDLRKPGADPAKILKEVDDETQKASEFAIPNELDQVYARMGLTGLNAYTASDATVYVSEVPKNRVVPWARIEGARFADPVFRLFWPELEAVYEEKNRSLDNPGRRVQEALLRALFPKHGYGQPGLGEVEHLKKPAYADMEAFFARYYTPGNMAILLAGDVDASILPQLEAELGVLRRPAGDAAAPGALPKPAGRVEVSVPVPSNEGVVLGWQLVSATHADRIALEVMDSVIFDGRAGILQRELLLPQKVTAASATPEFEREAGYYRMSGDALDKQTQAEVEALLLGVVGKVVRGEFTEADVATAVLHADIAHQRQLESNRGRMGLLEDAFINGRDWADVVGQIDRMRKVTRADVMRVAARYLDGNFVAVKRVKGVAAPPKITKPSITPVAAAPGRQGAFARAILELPVAPIEPVALRAGADYTRAALATGPLIAVENRRNTLFAASHRYELGRTDDRLVCLALEVLKVSGAGKRTPEQLGRQLHELGVTLDTRCSRTDSELIVSGPERSLDAGMALVREWLADPAIEAATVKARVAALLTERANAIASPQAIAGASQSFARFGDDSDFLVEATNRQLQDATPAQLRQILGAFLGLKHRTAYFGPPRKSYEAIALGDGKRAARAPRPLRFRKPNAVYAVDLETAQTHIWLVWPRRPVTELDRAAGGLFGAYVRPLLFQDVRELRGLAYTVFGAFGAGSRKLDESSLFAYVGTQGDKAQDALAAVRATLTKPIDEKRLADTKETLAQEHRVDRIAPRSIAAVVYQWDDEGEQADPRAARLERTLRLARADLEKWVKAAVAQPSILSITGDRKKLDAAALGKLAPVTFVPVAKLFGY